MVSTVSIFKEGFFLERKEGKISQIQVWYWCDFRSFGKTDNHSYVFGKFLVSHSSGDCKGELRKTPVSRWLVTLNVYGIFVQGLTSRTSRKFLKNKHTKTEGMCLTFFVIRGGTKPVSGTRPGVAPRQTDRPVDRHQVISITRIKKGRVVLYGSFQFWSRTE